MWVYLAVVEGTEGEANSGDWERRLVCGWRTDFCEWVRSVCDYEPVLGRGVRQALAPQMAHEGNGSASQKNETRRKRCGAFLLQEGLCALYWFGTCTQPKSWRMVKLRFAISGGMDDSNNNNRRMRHDLHCLPSQSGDQPRENHCPLGALYGRVESTSTRAWTSHDTSVVTAISPQRIY